MAPLAGLGPGGWRWLYLGSLASPCRWWPPRLAGFPRVGGSRQARPPRCPGPSMGARAGRRLLLIGAGAFLFALFATPTSQFQNEFLPHREGVFRQAASAPSPWSAHHRRPRRDDRRPAGRCQGPAGGGGRRRRRRRGDHRGLLPGPRLAPDGRGDQRQPPRLRRRPRPRGLRTGALPNIAAEPVDGHHCRCLRGGRRRRPGGDRLCPRLSGPWRRPSPSWPPAPSSWWC